MVALKIFDVLIQASHVYTVHIQWWLDWQEQACNHTVAATWTTLLFVQRHIHYNNIYYNLCTPTDDISFIDKQCTSLLSVYRMSVKLSESNAMGVVPRLSQWQALPWDVNQTCITVMNLKTCFGVQIWFALNKKLEHCTTTMCTVHIKGPPWGCLVVYI